MKRRGLQLSKRHRRTLYAVGLTLLLSGILWAWLQHLDQAGNAPEAARRWKTGLIALHGWSAMLFVLLFGTILPGHVRRGWHARKNLKNGIFFLSVITLLTLSGYALYYTADENWRAMAGNFHLWLGIAAPALLILHIRSGQRATMR
jgi:hypothetical protein